jgi:hypothetical protein
MPTMNQGALSRLYIDGSYVGDVTGVNVVTEKRQAFPSERVRTVFGRVEIDARNENGYMRVNVIQNEAPSITVDTASNTGKPYFCYHFFNVPSVVDFYTNKRGRGTVMIFAKSMEEMRQLILDTVTFP